MKNSIYERLRTVANEQKMSLQEIENKAGLSDGALYKWKKSSPKLENVQKVADVLGVSVDYLLGNTDEVHATSEKNTNQDFFKIDLTDIPIEERQKVIEQMEEIKKILMKDM
ncbi:DNA-binding helix-turn-helix protein [Weissella viridescens]|uniref:helix-turn-helix domain-containing protein n=1 Tax=Weissella viridescens TaxID=1629 RepID=UPI00092EAFA0|nr:helix-turn-helix transcriptional regulator [Weissella viridescens]SOB43893.1 DNA-binding helix-turn-helix protein [Weissella viridescens]